MNPVMTSPQGQTGEAELAAATAQARPTTMLDDVMATLHAVVEAGEDDLVVAVVAHWLRTGRLTLAGAVTVAASEGMQPAATAEAKITPALQVAP